jgi:hypothetical protein
LTARSGLSLNVAQVRDRKYCSGSRSLDLLLEAVKEIFPSYLVKADGFGAASGDERDVGDAHYAEDEAQVLRRDIPGADWRSFDVDPPEASKLSLSCR